MRSLLFALFVFYCGAHAEFVNSVEDFKMHCNLHQARVVALGLALRARYYPNVDVRHLENFLRLHDAAKTTMDSDIYSLCGFQSPPLEALYAFYGTTLPRGSKSELGEVTSRVNRIDEAISAIFFKAFGTNEAKELREIENLADLVDRGMDPVAAEEFGRPMRLASSYCKNENLKTYAEWLEQNYTKIVEGLEFPGTKDCREQLVKSS